MRGAFTLAYACWALLQGGRTVSDRAHFRWVHEGLVRGGLYVSRPTLRVLRTADAPRAMVAAIAVPDAHGRAAAAAPDAGTTGPATADEYAAAETARIRAQEASDAEIAASLQRSFDEDSVPQSYLLSRDPLLRGLTDELGRREAAPPAAPPPPRDCDWWHVPHGRGVEYHVDDDMELYGDDRSAGALYGGGPAAPRTATRSVFTPAVPRDVSRPAQLAQPAPLDVDRRRAAPPIDVLASRAAGLPTFARRAVPLCGGCFGASGPAARGYMQTAADDGVCSVCARDIRDLGPLCVYCDNANVRACASSKQDVCSRCNSRLEPLLPRRARAAAGKPRVGDTWRSEGAAPAGATPLFGAPRPAATPVAFDGGAVGASPPYADARSGDRRRIPVVGDESSGMCPKCYGVFPSEYDVRAHSAHCRGK